MIWTRETYVNATEGHGIGKDDTFTETRHATRGDLYRALVKEYGKCVSKMYREAKEGPDSVVGWVFQGRDRYRDTRETYLREVWVEVREEAPRRCEACHGKGWV